MRTPDCRGGPCELCSPVTPVTSRGQIERLGQLCVGLRIVNRKGKGKKNSKEELMTHSRLRALCLLSLLLPGSACKKSDSGGAAPAATPAPAAAPAAPAAPTTPPPPFSAAQKLG